MKRIKPCCFCSTEIGVYTALFFNLIYIVLLVVLGLIFSAWSWTILLNTTKSSDYKATTMLIWLFYVIYFLCEVLLGSYLLRGVNELDPYMCKIWLKCKYFLISGLVIMMLLHSLMHYIIYEVIAFCIILVLHAYYFWTVKHFCQELESQENQETQELAREPLPKSANNKRVQINVV